MLDAAVSETLQPIVPLGRDDQHRQCGSRWRVVRSHPQAEHWALTNLTRQGYTAYLPWCVVQVPDRVTPTLLRTVPQPLFRSYLFVLLGPSDPTFPIVSTYGVAQLLPGYARNGDVEALQAGDELRRHPPSPRSLWAPGVPCSLRSGAWCGVEAVVVDVGKDTARISTLIFGCLRQVTVQLDLLVPRAA